MIRSVLFSMQVYWSSKFIFPASVVERIERILRNFLWTGPSLGQGDAKVAWINVCTPCDEGGLGIKSLKDWNRAAVIGHIWRLLTKPESIWAAWAIRVLLRGRSFWQIPIPSNPSWNWRKMLQARDLAKPHILIRIGNGVDTHLWYDPWLPEGRRLIDIPGIRPRLMAHVPLNARVASIISEDQWNMPSFLQTWSNQLDPPNTALKDEYVWRGTTSGEFSISSAWNLMRASHDKVAFASML